MKKSYLTLIIFLLSFYGLPTIVNGNGGGPGKSCTVQGADNAANYITLSTPDVNTPNYNCPGGVSNQTTSLKIKTPMGGGNWFWYGCFNNVFTCSQMNDIVDDMMDDAENRRQAFEASSCPTGTTAVIVDVRGGNDLIPGQSCSWVLDYTLTLGCCHPNDME